MNDQDAAQYRLQCTQPRKSHALVEHEHTGDDQHQADDSKQFRQQAMPHLWYHPQRQQASGKQLPRPQVYQIEGRLRLGSKPQLGGHQRQHERPAQNGLDMPREEAHQEPQQRREQDIELFFHRQRPGVQKWYQFYGVTEIVNLVPVMDIGREDDRCRQAFGERPKIKGQEHQRRDAQHGEQRRQQPPDSTLVELTVGKTALLNIPIQDRGDQEAGNDEEYVDPDEAAGKQRNIQMKQHHRQHGERAQPIDILAIPRSRPRIDSVSTSWPPTRVAGGLPIDWRSSERRL